MDDPFSKVDVSSHIIAALNSTGKTLPYDVNHDTMFENPDSQCFVKPISEAGVGAMASTFFFLLFVCLFLLSRADRSCFLSSSLSLSSHNNNSYVHIHLRGSRRRDTAVRETGRFREC